ncbi:MAG TPA: RNA polymerase sigma factor [Nitrospiraceae bacterium]|jgi:RNA polymerase sigma-70 factor (ECF subfamily)|nr:RNA polymerase sigma factor [Nitrospiraceae bacterium]
MADETQGNRTTHRDDRELLRLILQGQTDLYADLIVRYQSHVARVVRRRVPPDDVEEVVHDVFVRAYMGLSQYSGSVSFDHWLSGIAVRACYDFWRAQKREAVPVSSLTDDHQRWIDGVMSVESEAAFHDLVRRREATEVLQWALNRLSPENRAVLTLVHLEGRSAREAASLLGWSLVNVKVRAHRARRALRSLLTTHSRGHL